MQNTKEKTAIDQILEEIEEKFREWNEFENPSEERLEVMSKSELIHEVKKERATKSILGDIVILQKKLLEKKGAK